MLLGRPTILTAYSGTSDFATGECAYLVDYRPVKVQIDQYLGVEQQSWADANVATAAHYMRIVHERPDEARRIGELGRERVMRQFDPAVIGPRLLSAVAELLTRSQEADVPFKKGPATTAKKPRAKTADPVLLRLARQPKRSVRRKQLSSL
jgi:hypothetical protein